MSEAISLDSTFDVERYVHESKSEPASGRFTSKLGAWQGAQHL